MKRIFKIISAVLFGLFCAIFGWEVGKEYGVEIQVKEQLPSLEYIQKVIGVKPDGIYGKETKEAWEKYLNTQFAISEIEKWSKK